MKKICCFVVCMCLLFGMSLQVEAKGISSLKDEVVDEQFLEQIGASEDEILSIQKVDVKDSFFATKMEDGVSDKGLINEVTYKITISKDEHEEQYYATVGELKGEHKNSSGSKVWDGTTVKGTIYWIDNSGPSNELVGVSMSRTTNYGSATYKYGKYSFQSDMTSGTWTGKTNFVAISGYQGFVFELDVAVPSKNGSTIVLSVYTSFFD